MVVIRQTGVRTRPNVTEKGWIYLKNGERGRQPPVDVNRGLTPRLAGK
jgi:hypothetical protein